MILVHDFKNKILSGDPNYIVDVIMFNNIGVALGIVLKFYTSVAKELKLSQNVRKFGGNC